MIDIEKNYRALQRRIQSSLALTSQKESGFTVVAVSKKRSLEDIETVYKLGLKNFGENFAQEAIKKIKAFKHKAIWHFIGSIQSNKVKPISENFDWVHTITRYSIAEKLDNHRPKSLPPLNVCVQIKLHQDDSRNSLPINQLLAMAAKIEKLPNLKLRGLMGMTRFNASEEECHQSYRIMGIESQNLKDEGFEIDTLSMGMSDDFEIAIHNHGNMIRIGTALFGPRQ
jgi:pyridoxal phosphate enzyme (YggS family)